MKTMNDEEKNCDHSKPDTTNLGKLIQLILINPLKHNNCDKLIQLISIKPYNCKKFNVLSF